MPLIAYIRFLAGSLLALSMLTASAQAQIKAFPQAEGYGAVAKGGRGGDVYHVTNLNDSGAGSLRFGVDNAPASGRTIVFDVGGWITINSKLGITRDNVTIAGQTAPGGGIGIKGNQFSVGADNIVLRHFRVRPGKGAGRVDSLSISSGSNVIFDHVSAGFSYDENASANGLVRHGVNNLTMQYSSIAFGLEDHSAGSLIQNTDNLSYHHNLYAHNNTRNPKARVEGDGMEWLGNVVYDYNNGFIAGDSDTSDYFWKVTFDGNSYITGPGDTGRPMITSGLAQNYGVYFGTNAYDNDGNATHNPTNYTGNGMNASGLGGVVSGSYTWSAVPYGNSGVWLSSTPQENYLRTLEQFGATPWNRDEVDSLLASDVVNRQGAIIAHENELVARGVSNAGFGTLVGGVKPPDTDNDGIADAWELKHGTNPNVANNNGDFDFDGYTDLEEYLNDLAAFQAIGPLEFSGVGRYADWERWTNRWEPSRLDDVEINNAAAFVDAIGQKAGTLGVGQTGRLYITSGWLEVTDDLTVGAEGRGSVRQYGGEVRILGGTVDILDGDYQLLGGRLSTPLLAKGANGTFAFTGGELEADVVEFDLLNQGGTISPGPGIDETSVLGDLTLAAGSLQIDIASSLLIDTLAVYGIATLGGALNVSLLSGYVPDSGQTWQLLTASEILGSFESITPGYSVQQQGNSLWLVAGAGAGGGSVVVPEPVGLLLFVVAIGIASTSRRLRYKPKPRCNLRFTASTLPRVLTLLMALALTVSWDTSAQADVLKTIADAQLSENGATGLGDATDAGNGIGTNLNARWVFSGAMPNRNEWIALKFDLSNYADKSELANIALKTYMFRTGTSNTTTLRLYALTPGVSGENWNEGTITYGSMPGFTFDGNSNTNILSVGAGNPLKDLGSFSVSGAGNEGNIATINPATLTSLVQGMGKNNLLTLLISFQNSATGQWRIASKEATATETSVLTGAAGTFASFLQFDIVHMTSGVEGDYNDNGVVDAADYTVWRNGGTLVNEGVSPNTVDIADYLFWKERYGATSPVGSGSAAGSTSVPEPGLFCLLFALPVTTLGTRRARR